MNNNKYIIIENKYLLTIFYCEEAEIKEIILQNEAKITSLYSIMHELPIKYGLLMLATPKMVPFVCYP